MSVLRLLLLSVIAIPALAQAPPSIALPSPSAGSSPVMAPPTSVQAPPPGIALPQQGAGTTAQTPPPAPMGRMFAVHARGAVPEKPHMDKKLKPVAKLLETLPFTTFNVLSEHEAELPWGEETLFPINAVFAMHVTPQALDEQQAITLRARIEMLQESGQYINALDTMAQAMPQQALLFRGLPLNKDELVVVLLVGMPQEPQQGEGNPEDSEDQQEEQNQEQQEQQQEQSEASDENEPPDASEGEGEGESEGEMTPEQQELNMEGEGEGESDEAQPMQQDDAGMQEGETPKDTKSLEALLQSLEETDKDEQVKERNRRDRIDFNGDWW